MTAGSCPRGCPEAASTLCPFSPPTRLLGLQEPPRPKAFCILHLLGGVPFKCRLGLRGWQCWSDLPHPYWFFLHVSSVLRSLEIWAIGWKLRGGTKGDCRAPLIPLLTGSFFGSFQWDTETDSCYSILARTTVLLFFLAFWGGNRIRFIEELQRVQIIPR